MSAQLGEYYPMQDLNITKIYELNPKDIDNFDL